MSKKYHMQLFFGIVFLQSLAANFAHPITPTLLMNLKVSEYMFGLAFATMSFTLFLFSPFWGKMREFFSVKILLLVGCLGYALGQFLFGIATTEINILVARLISGFFVGSIGVSILIYITEQSDKSKIGEHLAELAIIQALGSSFGYFVGGMVGVYSIPVTFTLQTSVLTICGFFFYFLLNDSREKKREKVELSTLVKEVNPLKSFIDCKMFFHKRFSFIVLVILIFSLGSNSFDQAFNYYLKAELNFSSAYNGTLKAITGVVTLLVVSTICMWIIKKGKIARSTAYLFFSLFFLVVGIMSLKQVMVVLALSVLFHSTHAIITPLLQDIMVKEGGVKGRSLLMGLYNSVRSLGMIVGALLSGFLYALGSKIPFVLSAFCLAFCAVIMFYFTKKWEA